jgi:predicted RNA-binding Zn-ribbon protein involved in translation (DUF1610 family)
MTFTRLRREEDSVGMFDSVFAKCPDCGEMVEFQTKVGPCMLARYSSDSVPASIAAGVNGDIEDCDSCGTKVKLHANINRITMQVIKVRDPLDGEEPEEYD